MESTSIRQLGVGSVFAVPPHAAYWAAPAGLQPQRCPPIEPHVNLEFRGFSVSAAVFYTPISRVRACCTGLAKASGKDGINIIGANVKNPSTLPLEYSLSITFTLDQRLLLVVVRSIFLMRSRCWRVRRRQLVESISEFQTSFRRLGGVRRIQAQSNIGALVRAAAALDHPSGSRARCARPSERRQFLIRRTMSTGTSRS